MRWSFQAKWKRVTKIQHEIKRLTDSLYSFIDLSDLHQIVFTIKAILKKPASTHTHTQKHSRMHNFERNENEETQKSNNFEPQNGIVEYSDD